MSVSNLLIDLPTIKLFDPLAQVLGAVSDGVLEYSFFDCVKLAGHSCPTVASAFLSTKFALAKLYGDDIPVRGNIKIALQAPKAEGVTGVIGSVAGFICGASDEGGFKGLGGQFARNNRLFYSQEIDGLISFMRLDTKQSITVRLDLATVETPEKLQPLMMKVMSGSATDEEVVEFGQLWQQKVRNLFDCADKHILLV